MKVAFSTSTGVEINGNFLKAREFSIWDIGSSGACYVKTIFIADGTGSADEGITVRANSLKECSLVCAPQISGRATARLAMRNIHTLKTEENVSVREVVSKLQAVLRRSNSPPWMHKTQLQSAGTANVHVQL